MKLNTEELRRLTIALNHSISHYEGMPQSIAVRKQAEKQTQLLAKLTEELKDAPKSF